MDNRFFNPNLESQEIDINLRPSRLDGFIGQQALKNNLKVFIEAAKARKESLDHVLFYGPPGLGKTTLSNIVAMEMEGSIKYTSGPAITKQGDLAAIISSLEEGDILFIDEIHRLSISVEEILYSAMEDFKIDFVVGEGPTARSLRIDLPRFTLIGATTRYGLLSSPLRDRFGISLSLDFYNNQELSKIVERSASVLGIKITQKGALEVAKRSRGTPRVANRLLKRIRDYLTVSGKIEIDQELANASLLKLGIDEQGLDDLDRKYIFSIMDFYGGGPVGISTIATVLSESVDTVEDTIEPFLLKKGYIKKTPRGRIISPFGIDYCNLKKLSSKSSKEKL